MQDFKSISTVENAAQTVLANELNPVLAYLDQPSPPTLPLSLRQDYKSYSTVEDAVQMVVANKVDLGGAREVTPEEGAAFARERGCMYKETSAKVRARWGDARGHQ